MSIPTVNASPDTEGVRDPTLTSTTDTTDPVVTKSTLAAPPAPRPHLHPPPPPPPPPPLPLSYKDHVIPKPGTTPPRSIRALFDATTITVYQAYSTSIASAAVETQRLSSSPDFLTTRTTWIKPSWNWMMYRSGYSHKEPRQERILAIRVTHEGFNELLRRAVVAGDGGGQRPVEGVVVQWDPERTVRIGKVDGGTGSAGAGGIRSIQIGIKKPVVRTWVDEWVVGIEDVTDRARRLKEIVELDVKGKVSVKELVEMGLVPVERCYDRMVEVGVRRKLGMRVDVEEEEEGEEEGGK